MIVHNDTITSRNNQLVKWLVGLQDKKGREESESFVADGIKLSLEAIDAGLSVTHVIINEEKREQYFGRIEEALSNSRFSDTNVYFVSDSVFDKISGEKSPQGVITVIKYLDFFSRMDIIYKEDFFLSANERAIVLCSVRDPSNLGAVIRSSVAFGTDRIILSDDSADVYNPKTVRSAMGSLFRVKITSVKCLGDFIDALHFNSRRIFAAELTDNAISLDEAKLSSEDIVIIGNEGHGIPKEISALCDGSVYIPISKSTESLNASVAAAIFMWEQRKSE